MSTIGYYICIPFAWLLRALYSLTSSYGWALILFTLVVKIVLLPFQMKSKKSMLRMNRFQPKIKEIQAKYANNQVKMNEEMQALYAAEGVNPMSGCLWSFLPFPILLALYSIIRQPLSRFMLLPADIIGQIRDVATTLGYSAEQLAGRAAFYEEIGLANFVTKNFDSFAQFQANGLIKMDYNFLGLDLTVMPTDVIKQFFTGGWPVIGVVLIPVLSAAISLLQSKVSMAGNPAASGDDPTARSSKMMMWMMPLLSLYIGFTLPAALGVYWIANSVFMIAQEIPMNKYYTAALEKEDAAREEQRKADRLKRMEEAKAQQKQREEMTLKDKKKAAESAKAAKAAKAATATTEAGRVGERPYARGRSFNPEHYGE